MGETFLGICHRGVVHKRGRGFERRNAGIARAESGMRTKISSARPVERARCHSRAVLCARKNQQQSMSATASMPTAINANSWRTWCTAASDTPWTVAEAEPTAHIERDLPGDQPGDHDEDEQREQRECDA
jgi:hypothetical protein